MSNCDLPNRFAFFFKNQEMAGEWWENGYASASQSKDRVIEAHHDLCSLLEGGATLPRPENNQKNCMQIVSRGTAVVVRDELNSSYIVAFFLEDKKC